MMVVVVIVSFGWAQRFGLNRRQNVNLKRSKAQDFHVLLPLFRSDSQQRRTAQGHKISTRQQLLGGIFNYSFNF